ncbi:MAG: PASTA domain-containing protein [Clostridia bacterium]|nr:PASTA domain-containing protein [Clostridia bacterium]
MALKTSKQKFASRAIFVLALLCIVGLGACIVSLAYVQLVKGGEYREKAAQNQLQDTVVAAERGIIYDANMTPLAESTGAKKIYVNPSAIDNNNLVIDRISERLSELLGVDKETIKEKCSRTGYNNITIKGEVDIETANKVSEFLEEKISFKDEKGNTVTKKYSYYIGITPDVKRYYSKPYLASSVLGYVGADNVGFYGLEQEYNSVLTGVPGRIITAKNGGTKSNSMPIEYKSVYDAKQGNSLVLTIDEYIQSYLENALSQAFVDTGCDSVLGIIMDTDTGAILGMASRGAGNFDLSDYYSIADKNMLAKLEAIEDEEDRKKAIENERYEQWRNICISDTYEPGSVFKIFTASALLEENLITLDETFTCTGNVKAAGSSYNCHKHEGHGTQNLTKALMNSCNPFFITRGLRLEIPGFNRYFEAFGFLDKTGIDLPGERTSVYFDIDDMILANVASASFGQTFEVTPIQMITAVNAVANGGKLLVPYIVSKQLDNEGNVIKVTEPTVKRQVISEKTSATMREMLELVVKEGTGKNAYVAGYRVAGKTGTSENLNTNENGVTKEYWASFACFAPANDPEITMLLVIDNPRGAHGGGAVAAPVASGIIEDVMQYLNVEPQYTQEELEKFEISAKDVVGKSVSEARSILSADSVNVKVRGDGETVIAQIPSAGQSVPKNGVVILYTSAEAKNETLEMPDLTGLSVNEATNKALAAGINIKISGNSLLTSELVSYKQSIAKGTQVEYGTVVTVSFKSNTGISDDEG